MVEGHHSIRNCIKDCSIRKVEDPGLLPDFVMQLDSDSIIMHCLHSSSIPVECRKISST